MSTWKIVRIAAFRRLTRGGFPRRDPEIPERSATRIQVPRRLPAVRKPISIRKQTTPFDNPQSFRNQPFVD